MSLRLFEEIGWVQEFILFLTIVGAHTLLQ
jgi:hypothetical protein